MGRTRMFFRARILSSTPDGFAGGTTFSTLQMRRTMLQKLSGMPRASSSKPVSQTRCDSSTRSVFVLVHRSPSTVSWFNNSEKSATIMAFIFATSSLCQRQSPTWVFESNFIIRKKWFDGNRK
ncbi:hypothetical protein [Prevotella nigrescens]|uniref:hypothetical protein n=2 Tax=Prevotella nigrescens TaxID=28133 RepID=UPI003C743344